ncbi:hypothetical protein DPEC_G00198560 [Dallia pectoralis]|uniref:Uncharacterized protein n=1 Tax=Dallia pectoralis TaxID=75939 RepID=A0ACC2G895_DALPE|nr:hypothetical protein DPEC_G00198560 [Dallia pectoralis]
MTKALILVQEQSAWVKLSLTSICKKSEASLLCLVQLVFEHTNTSFQRSDEVQLDTNRVDTGEGDAGSASTAEWQKRTETIAGMRAAVEDVRTSLKTKRDEASFKTLFEEATAVVQSLGVTLTVPQTRPPPKHFIKEAEPHQPKRAKDHYRGEFFKYIVYAQLRELFNNDDF